jgi:hypothetical protein
MKDSEFSKRLDEAVEANAKGEATDEDLRLLKHGEREGWDVAPRPDQLPEDETDETDETDEGEGDEDSAATSPTPPSGEDERSAGNSTETSSETTQKNNGEVETVNPSTAPTTEKSSKSGHKGNSTARPTGGSGRVR